MASIKTTLSAIEGFTSKNSAGYTAVLEIANDLLSRAERLHVEVRTDGETIENQIYRVKMVLDEASQKANRYAHEANEAAGDSERAQREIQYILDNPKKRTETDEDGNEITVEEIDYEALSVAQRKKEDADERYYYAKGKYQEAAQIVADAQATISKFESMAQAVTYVANSIESITYEIKKYIRMIEEEAEYNIQTLYSLIDKINNYLSTKPIFHPSGISSGDYSRGGSPGGGYSGGGGRSSMGVTKSTNEETLSTSEPTAEVKETAKKKIKVSLPRVCSKRFEKKQRKLFEKLIGARKEISAPARDSFDAIGRGNFYGVNGKHLGTALNQLIKEQGVNDLNELVMCEDGEMRGCFNGTCSLASFANILIQLGYSDVTEQDVVEFAYKHGICGKPEYTIVNGKKVLKKEGTGGGTDAYDKLELVKKWVDETTKKPILEAAHVVSISVDEIDKTLRHGGAVMLSLCGNDLKDCGVVRDKENPFKYADHAVVVTGLVRDHAGKVIGVTITDTGGHVSSNSDVIDNQGATVNISIEKFEEMRSKTAGFGGTCFFKAQNEEK
ncbi:MAG: C39 family peptidase [Clostridia bacterium]|nr:C39 family peptidase [Clostridia bacterium]